MLGHVVRNSLEVLLGNVEVFILCLIPKYVLLGSLDARVQDALQEVFHLLAFKNDFRQVENARVCVGALGDIVIKTKVPCGPPIACSRNFMVGCAKTDIFFDESPSACAMRDLTAPRVPGTT